MVHTLSAPIAVSGVSLAIKKGVLVAEETREYWLTADADNPTRASLLGTAGVPIPYQTISEFGICTATDLKQQKENRRLWKVSATFSSDIEDSSGGGYTSDPEVWVPRRETYLEPYQEIEFRDKDGKAYTNGAKVPFASAPAVDKDNIRWDFFQFEPLTVTDDIIADRNNTINSVEYKTRPKHTLLLKVRRSVVGTYYSALRRLTEYSIIYKASNWHEKMANVGNSFRTADGVVWPYRYRVLNADGSFNATESQVIHTGPLGIRDVPYDTNFVTADGMPTGGAVQVGQQWYALPANHELYFIERRRFDEANFATFLRI